jgi:hypothetical protein
MLHHFTSMRSILVLAALGTLAGPAACNRGDNAVLRRADGTEFSSSGGEVALADGSHLQFVITSQRYKQWDAARSALSPSVATRFGALLQPKSPTEQTIARAVAYLEGDLRSRQAIERAGMSVKDFVLMTVALEQEMRVASGQSPTRPLQAMPAVPYAPPIDTPQVVYPVIPKAQVDSVVKIDTVVPQPARDTLGPKRDTTPPARDTIAPRRDTLSPKRDSLRPPTPSKPARDTLRDTLSTLPREVVPRA